mgnify:FL=1|tara:strand:+ start:207 stop:428 length:222 start_codon:yes stop_codon:yes gene_type:complete
MSRNIPDHLRHSAHKEIVDAIIAEPKNQTLSSADIYKNKLRAEKLEAERYDSVMSGIDEMFNSLLEQMVKENQ